MRIRMNRRGFTMFELTIVLVIITIMSGIAVPYYMSYIRSGKKTEAYAVIDAVVAGGRIYFLKSRTYENGTFAKWLAQDDVDNADYFTFELSSMDAEGFVVTATERGDWAPANAKIIWTQEGADAGQRYPGNGEFTESGW